MSDLLPDDRALLDAARDGHEPTSADRKRLRAALVAQLGIGTGLTAATTSTAGVGVAAASAGLAAKAMVVAALLGAAGGGTLAYRASGHSSPPPAANMGVAQPLLFPPLVMASASPAAAVMVPVPALVGVPSGAARIAATARGRAPSLGSRAPSSDLPPAFVPTVAESSSGRAAANDTAESVSAGGLAAVVPLHVTATTLEHETLLVRRGIASLHEGDPVGALALFDEHARSYPDGVLVEERAAERVTALCRLGRVVEANAAATAFLREHPRSPLAPRVSGVCGEANP